MLNVEDHNIIDTTFLEIPAHSRSKDMQRPNAWIGHLRYGKQ